MNVSLRRFIAAAVVMLGGTAVLTRVHALDSLRRATAASAWWVTGLLGMQTTLIGSEIFTRTRVIDVATACLPMGVLGVYIAAVLATRTGARDTLIGIVVGVAALFAANILRVVVGVWAAQSAPSLFDALHAGVLQFIPAVAALFVWLAWASRSERAPR